MVVVTEVPELNIGNLYNLRDSDLKSMIDCFRSAGCVRVKPKETLPPELISPSLAALGAKFGGVVRHRLSDTAGVHPIRQLPGYPQYANTTSADLLLHTDGSFEKFPPRAMLIYCEKPAEQGGLSRICAGREVYRFLRQDQQVLQELFRPDAFTIRRDDRESSRAVFEQEGERLLMAFRYGHDVSLKVHPNAKQGFDAIVEFVSDPKNYDEFLLQKGELLLFDNTSVLHGRTEFPPNVLRWYSPDRFGHTGP
jgi:alpha-ketoglutarate-dependent taurine dioxygenase